MSNLLKHLDGDGKTQVASGDVVVVIDDCDCRFGAPECAEAGCVERFAEWLHAWRKRVAGTAPGVELVVLLAAPEIESWFVLDWRHGLGDSLSRCGWNRFEVARARKRIGAEFGAETERWGVRSSAGACAAKFSVRLDGLLAEVAPTGDTERYHKAEHGPQALAALDASTLSRGAKLYFGPEWRRLRALCAPPARRRSTRR